MIFAAGLGTRLFPLTADKPKALVEVDGKTLLELAIQKLINANVHYIVVNVHHFNALIISYLQTHHFDAEIVVSNEANELLDTGGGLKFAEPLLRGADHLLLFNVDIISSINLSQLIDYHVDSQATATLAVQQRETSRYLIFDEPSRQLCGWHNRKTDEFVHARETQNPVELAFSGIHVVKSELLNLLPPAKKQSLTPIYLQLARDYPIVGYDHSGDSWHDIGKVEAYQNYLKTRTT